MARRGLQSKGCTYQQSALKMSEAQASRVQNVYQTVSLRLTHLHRCDVWSCTFSTEHHIVATKWRRSIITAALRLFAGLAPCGMDEEEYEMRDGGIGAPLPYLRARCMFEESIVKLKMSRATYLGSLGVLGVKIRRRLRRPAALACLLKLSSLPLFPHTCRRQARHQRNGATEVEVNQYWRSHWLDCCFCEEDCECAIEEVGYKRNQSFHEDRVQSSVRFK